MAKGRSKTALAGQRYRRRLLNPGGSWVTDLPVEQSGNEK